MTLAQPVPPRLTAVPRVVSPDRTYWGLRSPDSTGKARARARLLRPTLPAQAFFTHTTAARLLGIPLPRRLDADTRLHATMASPERMNHSRGIVGHGLKMRSYDVIEVDAARLTGPERTWCDLGGILSIPELVAAGDFLIHRQDPMTSPFRLACEVEDLPNRRYVRSLRTAVTYLDDLSESPPESMLRVILSAGGFPPPIVTRSLLDGYGEYVAHTDFLVEELGLVLHYRSADTACAVDDPCGGLPYDDGNGSNALVVHLDADDLRDPRGLIDRIWLLVRTRGAPR
jgi:hypothetical protein